MITPVGQETFTIDVRGIFPDFPEGSSNNFVINTSDTVTGVTVPEPTSNLGLLAVGILGLVSAFKYQQKV
ncbi:MAG: PEP-CTERM sorting domain-containing protein [Crocosphaera sp.]|nr:PEP-CTERM sorting domain-containing protein [Crocosphaera sp.]